MTSTAYATDLFWAHGAAPPGSADAALDDVEQPGDRRVALLLPELRPHGVDVLVASPGPVRTGFGDRAGMTMPAGASAEMVAAAVLRSIGRRVSVVPGLQAELLTAALAIAPRRLRTRIMHRVMRGMRGPATAPEPS